RFLVGRHTTRCIRVAWRAELMLSLMAMTKVRGGEPSLLMMSQRSHCVMALLGGKGSLVGVGTVTGGIFPIWVVGFLALLVTWAHEKPWIWEGGGGMSYCIATGVDPVTGGGGGTGGSMASTVRSTPSPVVRRGWIRRWSAPVA